MTTRRKWVQTALAAAAGQWSAARAQEGGATVLRGQYRGWADAVLLRNAVAEVIVVPSVGRIMQFRLRGETDGPFWENEALGGQAGTTTAGARKDFGGDKAWPSPQAAWPQLFRRHWPPPAAFDGQACELDIVAPAVLLTSAVEPASGLQLTRRIELHETLPFLQVRSTFTKVSGAPAEIGVWTATQLKEPVLLGVPLPKKPRLPGGWLPLTAGSLPADLRSKNGLLTLRRARDKNTRIGAESGSLLWVGAKTMLKIDAPRSRDEFATYPDQGISAAILTSGDPLKYVELQMLSPLKKLSAGQSHSASVLYKLLRRTKNDPLEQTRMVLGR